MPRRSAPVWTLDRATLEEWIGRRTTPEERDRIARAIPYSSIPEALSTIADGVRAAITEEARQRRRRAAVTRTTQRVIRAAAAGRRIGR